jgi:hypothetical protein
MAGDKVHGSPEHQAFRAVVRKFVQTFIWENPAARTVVDSRLSTIGGGADEVMERSRGQDSEDLTARLNEETDQWPLPTSPHST